MRITVAAVLILSLLALPACQMNERMSGTAFGAGTGLVLGGLLAETLAGALIGGVAGGVAGYLIGDYLADQRERCSPPQPCQQPCPQPCPQPYPQPCPQPCAPSASGCYPPQVGGVRGSDSAWRASQAAVQRGRRGTTLPEARAAYEEAVRLDPKNAEAWNALGLSRLAAGEQAGAEEAFAWALRADPDHFAAKRNLAWARGGAR